MQKILCMGITPENEARLLLKKIQYGELYEGMKVQEIYRKAWKGMREREKTIETLRKLENYGYIRIKKQTGLGGTSESILINPNFGGIV